VLELAAGTADAYTPCASCDVRLVVLRGPVYNVRSTSSGEFRLPSVEPGSYLLYRVCGETLLDAHSPWLADEDHAGIAVPTSGPVDILVPRCPGR
jgi:hypothetical protein